MKKNGFGTAWLAAALVLWLGSWAVHSAAAVAEVATKAGDGSVKAATTAMSAAAPASAPAHPPAQLPPPSALESQYGIQIAQVGLAASGGLVDVRFRVLDAVKVKALLDNPANAPLLISGDKPPLQPPHHALRGARYAKGQVFYILYPNVRSLIQPGVEVTVAMGEARLGPHTVR
jgi:hypothetical protein